MTDPGAQQSNPYSTGGGGPNFETRVQAAFALMLLTGGVAPALPPHPLHTLKLQGRYAGFHVDDFIAYVRDPLTGQEAKLLAQIKHKISITAGNAIFAEVIAAAWRDFQDRDFNPAHDSLALITGPLSSTDIQNVRPLLEWARQSANSEEFLGKVATEQFSSDAKRAKLAIFKTHLDEANGGQVADAQLWSFLRTFHLIGYDLDLESGSVHSLLLSFIGYTSYLPPAFIWGRLLDAIQTANQNAGTITIDTLPDDLQTAFTPLSLSRCTQDIQRFEEHGRYILDGIRSDVGGVHISQVEALSQFQTLVEDSSFVWVSGARGSGKSSLVRTIAQHVGRDGRVFCLRTEDLDQPSLTQVFSALGIQSSLREFGASLALLPKKYLFIESLEKLLELEHQGAFRDLLQFLRSHPGWTIVASGREYAYQQVTFEFLQSGQVSPTVLVVPGFSDAELEQLSLRLPPLQGIVENPTLRTLLTNPFMAALAYQVVTAGAVFSPEDGEREFRVAVWRDVIAREGFRSHGMPARRRATFIQVALRRAKQMLYTIPEGDFDAEVISRLVDDHLLFQDDRTHRISPAHDVLEDWALEEFISDAYDNHPHDIEAFLLTVGNEPAMNRAFRLWLQHRLRHHSDTELLVLNILRHPGVERYWQDEAVVAILQSDSAATFLHSLDTHLLEADGALLQRFCFLLRVACQTPNIDGYPHRIGHLPEGVSFYTLRPVGPGWEAMVTYALAHKDVLPDNLRPHLAAVLKDWTSELNAWTPHPSLAREVGLLALHLLHPLKNEYRMESVRSTLLDVIIKTAAAVSDEFVTLVEQDILQPQGRRERPAYAEELCKKLFLLPGTAFVCASHPDLVIRVAWKKWLKPPADPAKDAGWGSSYSDMDGHFGLQDSEHDFFPASGLKGPFVYLLNQHVYKGLDFIVELCNHAAVQYAHSGLEQGIRTWNVDSDVALQPIEQIELHLNDGIVVPQYVSDRLWLGYRGNSVIPYVLQCALMALENWLIALAEQANPPLGQDIFEQIYMRVLKGSNSVLTTAVLASVATGFPKKLGHLALPMLSHSYIHSLEISRFTHDQTSRDLNWFGMERDAFSTLYAEERRTSNSRPWRDQRLENLLVQLQFSPWREEALATIDIMRAATTGGDSVRFLLLRTDSRGWIPEVDEKQGQITFKTADLEPDLAELQQQNQVEQSKMGRFITLFMWARNTFDRKLIETVPYASWHVALGEARTLAESFQADEFPRTMYESALIITAALCLRDYHSELTSMEAQWCIEVTTTAALQHADNDAPRGSGGVDLDGTLAAATVLPLALDFAQSREDREQVKRNIVVALTHSDLAVQMAAAAGIRHHLWQRAPEFAAMCITGVLEFARFEYDQIILERRQGTLDQQAEVAFKREQHEAKHTFQEAFLSSELSADVDTFSFNSHSSRHLVTPALMVPDGSLESLHVRLITRLMRLLFAQENQRAEQERRRERSEIPQQQIQVLTQRFAEFLLAMHSDRFQPFTTLLLEGCEQAPSLLYSLELQIALITERSGQKNRFWQFWNVLSPTIQDMAIREVADDRRSETPAGHRALIRGFLFADTPWQPVDYDNQNIGLGKASLIEFARNAGINRDVSGAMASLMYHFPALFFQEGVHVLADWQAMPRAPSLQGDPAFHIEIAIQRYLQLDHPGPISRRMYTSCLILLTKIVETASARSYYLREQLIRSRRVY